MANSTFSRSLLNIILVLVEAVMTLILRFDSKLRQAAYPLAKNETLVCIRTYLPHTQVYATFSQKGVLLDNELPIGKTQPNVIINAYTHQIIGALFGNHPSQVDALQIRGEHDDVVLVKTFLLQIGIGAFIQNLITKFSGKPTDPENTVSKAEKMLAIKEELAQKTEQIDHLTITNQRLSTQLAELKSKSQSSKTALIVMSVIAVIAIVAHFFR